MKQERKETGWLLFELLECGDIDKHFLICVIGDKTWVWNYTQKLSN